MGDHPPTVATRPMRLIGWLVLGLSGWIAVATPLQVGLAWSSVGNAAALGAAPLTSYPPFVVVVVMGSALVHALVMLLVVRWAWAAIALVGEAQFLSPLLASCIRKIGIALLVLAAANVVGLTLAIIGGAPGRSADEADRLPLQVFRLPAGLLISGLISLMVANAFDHARSLSRDAQLMI